MVAGVGGCEAGGSSGLPPLVLGAGVGLEEFWCCSSSSSKVSSKVSEEVVG